MYSLQINDGGSSSASASSLSHLTCTHAGVLLYVILAGNLPFDEPNLPNLFKKISRADYSIPTWFTRDMTSLFKAILNPDVKKRYAVICGRMCMHP